MQIYIISKKKNVGKFVTYYSSTYSIILIAVDKIPFRKIKIPARLNSYKCNSVLL